MAAWPDALVAVVLLLAAALWFRWLADAASTSGVITGEEASISHRDALSVALHWQPSIWSTNFGSQVFYWAAGHLTPHYDLLYGRAAKALATALLAPLVYVVARRRLGCAMTSSIVGAVAVAVLPGVSTVAWVATENGLEAVWGVAALFVATSRRWWWPVGLVLAGVSVSNYTAGLAWAAVVVLVAATRVVGPRAPGLRAAPGALAGLVAGLVAGLAVVFAPLLWWDNGGIVVTGGGYAGASAADVPNRLAEVAHYAAVDGSSYYYFSSSAMLGGRAAAVTLLLLSVAATVARPRRVWPWTAVALAAVGLYTVSSGIPGSRRLVAVAVVAALLLAVGTDVVATAMPRRALAPVVAAVALLALGAATVPATSAWHERAEDGALTLPVDWPFPVDPGGTQGSTIRRLDTDLRSGRLTPAQVAEGWGGTRTLAVLAMLSARTGVAPPLLPADILAAYRASADCRDLDGAGCG